MEETSMEEVACSEQEREEVGCKPRMLNLGKYPKIRAKIEIQWKKTSKYLTSKKQTIGEVGKTNGPKGRKRQARGEE